MAATGTGHDVGAQGTGPAPTEGAPAAPDAPARPEVEVVLDVWDDRYRTDEFLAAAIDELREEFGNPSERFGVYFLDGLDPRSSLGRAVEVERFGEEFANDVDMLRDLYGDFEDAGTTEMICVVDHEARRPAGVIRTVVNTAEHGCRILNDLRADGENGWGLSWDEIVAASEFAAQRPEEIIDIPTIAVSKGYGRGKEVQGVSMALFSGVCQQAQRSDAHTWVCSLERVPYQIVQAATHGVMQEFDGVDAKAYYGAPDTVPLWANFREWEAWLRRDHPSTRSLLFEAAGLTDYFFGVRGEPRWPSTDSEVIDLRRYERTDAGTGSA